MSKTESLELKGWGILMMLWLHLFSQQDVVEQNCFYYLNFFNGRPLCYVLTRLCACCVPLFVFLGGYGLAKVYTSKGVGSPLRRSIALMAELWIVCVAFVAVTATLFPANTLGGPGVFAANMLGVHCTYNGTWWFMLPYALVTAISPWLVQLFWRSGRKAVAGMLAGCFVLKLLEHFGADAFADSPFLAANLLAVFLYAAGMLLMFAIGVLFVRWQVFEASGQWFSGVRHRSWLFSALLLLLCTIKMFMGCDGLLNLPFVIAFVLVVHNIRFPSFAAHALAFFGKYSSMMWLVHAFFLSWLLSLDLYSLHYPLFLFAALVAISLSASFVLTPVYRPLRRRIMT